MILELIGTIVVAIAPAIALQLREMIIHCRRIPSGDYAGLDVLPKRG